MAGAVHVEFTSQGVRSVVVEQELLFFIGPSPDNPLGDLEDAKRREVELNDFLPAAPRHAQLIEAITSAYGQPIRRLEVTVRFGGMRGHPCFQVCIDLVKSETADGTMLFQLCDPRKDIAISRYLLTAFQAEWVVEWWTGSLGHAQLTLDAAGQAECIYRSGRREVLS